MDAPGKQAAFLTVIEAHKGIIYKVANTYCGNAEDSKDLVQEIVVQVWKAFDNYSDQYKYSTWIYRIALNAAISFYRKENRRKQVFFPLPEALLDDAATSNSSDKSEALLFLRKCVAELKEIDKALLLLYLEEKSQKEIAGILGMSVTNVATKIGRIKKVLQQKFLTIKS